MSILKDIKSTCCPICGEKNIINEKIEKFHGEIREHTNRSRWESREFLCGYITEYIPNFSEEYPKEGYRCVNDPSLAEKKRLRKITYDKSIQALHALSDEPDIIQDFLSLLIESVEEKQYRINSNY